MASPQSPIIIKSPGELVALRNELTALVESDARLPRLCPCCGQSTDRPINGHKWPMVTGNG